MLDGTHVCVFAVCVHPQHPFKILRRFMKGHPDLNQASTQLGFAQLVDCSLGLIRAVELGTKITPKLAKKVQAATGVSIPWLSKKQDPEEKIPAASGGTLTHEAVLARIGQERERYIQEAERDLLTVAKIKANSAEPSKDPSTSMRRRMASAMARLVEEALFESLNRGETRLMDDITRILARDLPAEEADSGTSGDGD